MRTTASLLFVLVAACGGASEPATTPPDNDVPPATGPTCADAGANAMAQMEPAGDELTADQRSRLEALLVGSCNDDAWSPDAVRCVAESKGEDLEKCEAMLPPGVPEKVGDQVRAILSEGHGEDAEPPPP